MPAPHTNHSSFDDKTCSADSNSRRRQCLDYLQNKRACRREGVLRLAGAEIGIGQSTDFCLQATASVGADVLKTPRGQELTANPRANIGKELRAVVFPLVSKANINRCADRIFLVICFAVILFVSAADTWFVLVNENILYDEMNPICEWLLCGGVDNCACFVAGKICGILVVLLGLSGLLRFEYRYARLVIAAVTLFQLGLFAHLCLADPLTDGWINIQLLFDETEPSIFLNHFPSQMGPS